MTVLLAIGAYVLAVAVCLAILFALSHAQHRAREREIAEWEALHPTHVEAVEVDGEKALRFRREHLG